MAAERLADLNLDLYFPESMGWMQDERPLISFDHGQIVPGSPLKCIDRHFGITKDGKYDPSKVPPSPAWPGGSDGVIPYMPGDTLEAKEVESTRRTRKAGTEPARHGDYRRGDKGCAFRRELLAGKFEDLPEITEEEHQVLMAKGGTHFTFLYRPEEQDEQIDPEAFVLNDNPGTFVRPDGGRYYPIETYFGKDVGIPYEISLPMIEKTGRLILPENRRRIIVAVG